MKHNKFLRGTIYFTCLAVALASIPEVKFDKSSQSLRQAGAQSQSCNLICPGRQPFLLPPNFIQNYTSPAKPPAAVNNSTTTTKRPVTTTQNSEESNEDDIDDNEEEDNQQKNSTTRNKKNNKLHRKSNMKHRLTKHKKSLVRKQTRILRRKSVNQLLKHHKIAMDKARLEGCYVECPDIIVNPPGNNQGNNSANGSSIDDNDNDNYVNGEDTPIEIVYIPSNSEAYTLQSPDIIYQINNYELQPPVPVALPEFGYDDVQYEAAYKSKTNKRNRKKQQKNDVKRSST